MPCFATVRFDFFAARLSRIPFLLGLSGIGVAGIERAETGGADAAVGIDGDTPRILGIEASGTSLANIRVVPGTQHSTKSLEYGGSGPN